VAVHLLRPLASLGILRRPPLAEPAEIRLASTMVFREDTWRIAVFIVLTMIGADVEAASIRRPCPDVIEGKDVRMKRDLHFDLPNRGRSGFADASGVVTCSVKARGFLSNCKSSIADARGPALSKQISRWRVLSTRLHGCPVVGRKILFRVRLRYTD